MKLITMGRGALVLAVATTLVTAAAVEADTWGRRFGNDQNTSNAGSDPGLTPEGARHMKLFRTLDTKPPEGRTSGLPVNATPVVSDGLVFFGDWWGFFYVFDAATGDRLIALDTGARGIDHGSLGTYTGVQSTANVATIDVPLVGPERRVYFGANQRPETLYCLNVDAILAARDGGNLGPDDPGTGYFCGGDWPIDLAAPAAPVTMAGSENPNSTYNGAPVIATDVMIEVGKNEDGSPVLAEKDVIFTPSTGLDCANGEFYAIDAVTGAKYWTFDPVVNGDGNGGVVWTAPAMNAENDTVFITTGDCVQKPQAGEKAESLVALDAATGVVKWHHQRRLVDVADLDIGNAPTVADVDLNGDGDYGDEGECRLIVSTDKDGCIYGFPQEKSIPEVGDLDFDPLRIGQQRLLWRTCFVTGSLNGGFNASGASLHGRTIFAQSNPMLGRAPEDNASTFAVDACTGEFRWASTAIGNGRGEGAIASGMFFQPSGSRLHVAEADEGTGGKPDLLARIQLTRGATSGGGGPAIADGHVYVPTSGGVDVLAPVEACTTASPPADCVIDEEANRDDRMIPDFACCNASPPADDPVVFNGPYPYPLAPNPSMPLVVDPSDPYPPVVDTD